MKVTQLARHLNVTPDTVRYYTRIKLLRPKKSPENGYKNYPTSEINRLHFIVCARDLGFSVEDIQEILAESDAGHSACPRVRDLIELRLQETQVRLQHMQQQYDRMKLAVSSWHDKPDMAPTDDMICHLIEKFGMAHFVDSQEA
ncbi:MerR family transcriptional regulator [Motilimonas cestriensis]|uniref:MerR family transcriptional regulator n=1 Tax=Motilimonas cestriensis TaxID=2742685 RepID=A0ABS8W4L5_9GAMM|nr:MerR family transcriptional regulator [Motilimonas cestriensis]MCE2593904.1 MerR family transcriptional regulator [Motilimonas cestriensis]